MIGVRTKFHHIPSSLGLKSDGTDDEAPGGRYATDHCPVVVYV